RLAAGRPGSEQAIVIDTSFNTKEEIAEKLPQPRIIVAGGSGVLFGVSAGQIEEATGMPCVNYGVHAGLALRYLLHRTLEVAREGDLVIFIPEYWLLVTADVPNDVLIEYI